jgi:SpoIID/LytB domain protein
MLRARPFAWRLFSGRPTAVAAIVVLGVSAAPAHAARKRLVPPPPPSVAVDVARIEPLAPGTHVVVESGGEYRGVLELRRAIVKPPPPVPVPGVPPAPPPPAVTGVGVVNEVGFEDYLKGIAEVPAGWPAEALRAQAIAARTYALWVLENGAAGAAGDLGAQICATEGCQVYAGLAKERAPNAANWVAAVESTAGQVLLYQGQAIVAKYSSSNGGRSVSGGRPYLKPVDDPDDARSPLHRWTLSVSFDDVGRAVAAPGTVTAVRRAAGSVAVGWSGADGGAGEVVVPATEFRAKVNAAVPPPPGRSRTVPSIMFDMAADGGARVVNLAGRGYGHGIGMSQYGAFGKAARGLKADAILASYYGGLRPATLPAGRLPATVKVAVDDGRPEARVGATGPFRVLDGKGHVVAAVATGAWRVTPGPKGGLRLFPPPGQTGPAAVELVAVEPATGAVGQPLVVRFKPRVPALVRVVATPPGGPETEVLPATAVGNGEQSVTLPPPAFGGAYIVRISADAGAGRTAELVLPPPVAGPPPPPAPAPPPAGGETLPSRLARASRAESAAPVVAGAKGGNEGRPVVPVAAGVLVVFVALGAIWSWRSRKAWVVAGDNPRQPPTPSPPGGPPTATP